MTEPTTTTGINQQLAEEVRAGLEDAEGQLQDLIGDLRDLARKARAAGLASIAAELENYTIGNLRLFTAPESFGHQPGHLARLEESVNEELSGGEEEEPRQAIEQDPANWGVSYRGYV
jgi:hypothetical protein